MIIIFLLFYFLLVTIFMYTNYFDIIVFRSILKGLCGFMFVLLPFLITNQKTKKTKYFKTMISGFTLAAIGDILLDVDNSNFSILFVLGMVLFALTHIMFSISFLKHTKFNKITIISMLCILIPCILLINCFNLINAGNLTPVINIYTLIISLMLSLAITLFTKKELNKKFRKYTLLGVVLFAISDLILLFALFGNNPTKKLLLTNNLIYYIAQIIIGLSFYKIKHTYKK